MNQATKVTDLATGSISYYSLPPRDAVIAAFAQNERNDWETWNYTQRYAGMVRQGNYTVTCGDFTALTEQGQTIYRGRS